MFTKEQLSQFEELATPLIEWLNANTNPHASILIDCNCAEINYSQAIVHHMQVPLRDAAEKGEIE